MSGDVGGIKAFLGHARESIAEATKSARSSTANNDSADRRAHGVTTWAKATQASLILAMRAGEEALSAIRLIESETDHPDPRTIDSHLVQGVEQVQQMLFNIRLVLEKMAEVESMLTANTTVMPANFFNLADSIAERYQRSM